MPVKKKSLSKLKKDLDRVFSQYIRLRDSDGEGYVTCITCGNRHYWKEVHCGHFVSRKHLEVRFDERNTAGQCCRCNLFDSGRQYQFGQAIDFRYGKGTAETLMERAKTLRKISTNEYEQLIGDYREKARELAKQKGISL